MFFMVATKKIQFLREAPRNGLPRRLVSARATLARSIRTAFRPQLPVPLLASAMFTQASVVGARHPI
jgi:hypothetical protein